MHVYGPTGLEANYAHQQVCIHCTKWPLASNRSLFLTSTSFVACTGSGYVSCFITALNRLVCMSFQSAASYQRSRQIGRTSHSSCCRHSCLGRTCLTEIACDRIPLMMQSDCVLAFSSILLLYSTVLVFACTSAKAVFPSCVCSVDLCRQSQRLAGEFRECSASMPTCTWHLCVSLCAVSESCSAVATLVSIGSHIGNSPLVSVLRLRGRRRRGI